MLEFAPEPLFYRIRDVSALTGLSRSKILRAIKQGALRASKLEGCVLIPAEALRAYLGRATAPGKLEDELP